MRCASFFKMSSSALFAVPCCFGGGPCARAALVEKEAVRGRRRVVCRTQASIWVFRLRQAKYVRGRSRARFDARRWPSAIEIGPVPGPGRPCDPSPSPAVARFHIVCPVQKNTGEHRGPQGAATTLRRVTCNMVPSCEEG